MTPEQKQRLEQIESGDQPWRQTAYELGDVIAGHDSDVDFLLSLVKSQELTLAEEVDWRREHDAKMIESMAAQGRWIESLQSQLNNAATSMRSACVEKVRELQDQWAANRTTFGASNDRAHIKYGTMVDASRDIIIALESLSIEKPKE